MGKTLITCTVSLIIITNLHSVHLLIFEAFTAIANLNFLKELHDDSKKRWLWRPLGLFVGNTHPQVKAERRMPTLQQSCSLHWFRVSQFWEWVIFWRSVSSHMNVRCDCTWWEYNILEKVQMKFTNAKKKHRFLWLNIISNAFIFAVCVFILF